MALTIVKLQMSDGTWAAFEADWKSQCTTYGEEFESYAEGTFAVVRELIEKDSPEAGVFAFETAGQYVAMCQANVTGLPGYDSPVMRVRFLTLCPDMDFGEKTIDDYAKVLVTALAGLLALSDGDGPMKARHLKFHLSSPADRQFFAALGGALDKEPEFSSVTMRGAWLYITKS